MKNLLKFSVLALLGFGLVSCADDNEVSTVSEKIPTCVNNAVKCADNGMMTYVCQNGDWVISGSCPLGCMNGICVTNASQQNNAQNGNDEIIGGCVKGSRLCSDDEKKVIRYFMFDNLNLRIKILNENNIDKKRQYLLLSINKLNFIIVQIASKDWPKSWPNLKAISLMKAKIV